MDKYAARRSTLALTIGSALATSAAQAATITVDTAQDGPIGSVAGCSLREAIASANDGNSQGGCAAGSATADNIVFDPLLAESVITLSEGEFEITNSLTISGPLSIGSISALFPDFQRYPEPCQAGPGRLPKSPARRIPSHSTL